MNSKLKNMIRSVYKMNQHRCWKSEMKKVVQKSRAPLLKPLDIKGRILILVPHADDELIGCHNLICQNKARISLFFMNYTGSNHSKENAETRKEEFITYCKKNQISYKISDNHDMNELKSYIAEVCPSLIMVPTYIDWHEEHRKCSEQLLQVLVHKDCYIGWYQISVPLSLNLANSYTSMKNKDLKDKWEIFLSIYQSQAHLPVSRFMIREKELGRFTKDDAIEVYCIMDYNEFKEKTKRYSHSDFSSLKDKINHLYELYQDVEHIMEV